jgi:predicted ATP-grasp superfamily ATP-dependent carboligase
MPTPEPLACVIGDIDLVRPLGLAGIPCAVVAKPGDPIRYSRFTRCIIDWLDPWKEPEALVERLLTWAKGQPRRPVLFYEEDRDLLLVSRHRERLAAGFDFVVPNAELVEDLVDKARFQGLAERAGLPVPPTRRLNPTKGASLPETGLRFPIIVKPLTRKTDQWVPIAGSNKALRVDDAQAFANLWKALSEAELPVMAQELIPGPETRIESYHVFVDRENRIAGEFTGRKVRTYPAEFGYSTALTITDAADVRDLGRELVRRLSFQGIAKFDFKRDADGQLYLLEVNARFNLWHHLGAVAGVNLPALVYRSLTTGSTLAIEATARPGARWCYMWYDAAAAREWNVPLWKWAPWALGCEAKSCVALDDPMPFLRGVVWRKIARAIPTP